MSANGRGKSQGPKSNWPTWAKGFLAAFEGLGTVTQAAAAAEINPSTAYRLRDRDPAFREEWDSAEEDVTNRLEAEAYRRATEGVEKPIFHNGEQIGSERKFSDVLTIFLLKARRPDVYRDRLTLEDDREDAERKQFEQMDESQLDEALTGLDDNVIPIRKAS